MNRIFKVMALTIGCLLLASAVFAQYTEFVVEPGGSGTTYPDLASAVATAQAFTGEHRIVIMAGAYSDVGVVIDHTNPGKIREIVGEGKDLVSFTSGTDGSGVFLDPSGTTDLMITGITVASYEYGIRTLTATCTGLIVRDCIFDDNGVDGYAGAGDADGGAIRVHGNDLTVEDCEVMNGERGIRIGNYFFAIQDNVSVLNNYVHDNEQYGIYLAGLNAGTMNNAIVDGNVLENNADAGLQVWANGATLNSPTVSNNSVSNSTWEGIIVEGATGGSVTGNTVTGNSTATLGGGGNSNASPRGGIYMPGCTSVLVSGNTSYANGVPAISGSEYGLWISGATNTVTGNCLFDHAGVEGWDGGDGTNWWNGNYYEELAGSSYVLDGSGGETDWAPMLYDNSASGAASVEVLNTYDVDINWTIPGCSELDAQELAAYEFTVSYDPTKLDFEGASYNMDALGAGGFFGSIGDGALYTAIAVDEGAGTITFAATNFDIPYIGDGVMASVQFSGSGVGASQITIGSQYLDAGAVPIIVGNTPLDVLVEDTEIPVVETLDIVDGVGANTFGLLYDMEISGTVSDNFDLYHIWYRFDDAGGWQSIGTVDGDADVYGPIVVDLSLISGDGSHTLNLMVRDQSSNDGFYDHVFTLDNTGPVASALTLTDPDGCADAGWTSNATVDIAWSESETAVDWELALTGFPEGWLGSMPTDYTFVSGDGPYTLHVRLMDAYGNIGAWTAGTSITLDQIAPAPSAPITIPAGTTGSATFSGDCNLDGASGAIYAKAVLGTTVPDCGDIVDLISGLGVSPRFDFEIIPPTDGTYDVTFASMDAAGNVGSVSTTIDLDMTPTEIDEIIVADATGSECSDSWTVSVTVEWTGTDVANLYLGTATGVYGAPIDISAEVSPFTTLYTIVGGVCADVGSNTVFGMIEDGIGNESAEDSDDILVDCLVPIAGTMVLNGANSTWTDDPVVSVDFAGWSADVNEVFMSEVSGDYSSAVIETFGASTTYDFGAPAENTWVYLYAEAEDCADRRTGEVSGRVAFDLTDPLLSDVEINSGDAITNNAIVSVDFTLVESNPTTVYIAEAADMSGATSYPWAGGPPYAFTLTSGDDPAAPVYVQVEDLVGRLSSIEMDDIELDSQAPLAGDLVLTSGNALAVAGYTDALTGNTFVFTPDAGDADVAEVLIRNEDNLPTLDWVAFTYPDMSGAAMLLDHPGSCGDITVEWYLKDMAGNQSGPFTTTIDFCPTAPPAPINGAGMPGGSVTLSWDPVANAQGYQIRYNFSGEYPLYGSPVPPFPATMAEGIMEVMNHPTASYEFDGPQDDLYAFGVWTLSNHGVWSVAPNMEILEHNYRLGDFMDTDENPGSDGCLSFDPEFVALAVAYDPGEAASNENLDIAPTSDGTPTGVAEPDGFVDFEDLVVFAQNYMWSRNVPACDGQKIGSGGVAASVAELTISAEIPAFARVGTEFSVPISISSADGISGFHLIFGFDQTALELVSVNPGNVYQGVSKSFFYHDVDAPGVDISSVVLSNDFEAGEIAVITFRTRETGNVNLEDQLLDVRGWNNEKVDVDFELAAKGGTLPTEFTLSQNYPNPFNPNTTIELALPEAAQYRLTVFNIIGQVVDVFEGHADAGIVTFNWDASRQSSGVYLYRVTAGSYSAVRKMVLLK